MNNNKRRSVSSPAGRVLIALSVPLLLFGGISGARAVLTYDSEKYESTVSMDHIGVSLIENEVIVSTRNYSDKADGTWEEVSKELFSGIDEDIHLGTEYKEEISVKNTGSMDEFVRVTVLKYWEDKDGKRPDLDSEYIKIGYSDSSKWMEDSKASTEERSVYYYSEAIAPDKETDLIIKSVTIDPKITDLATQESEVKDGKTVITTTYDYDGATFKVVITVDAVQTHNAEDAIKSAWGQDVTVSGAQLKLG